MIHPIAWLAGEEQPTQATGTGVGSQTINGVRRCLMLAVLALDFLAVSLAFSGAPQYGLLVSVPAWTLWWMHRNTYRKEVR
jgi:hypothetical protein